MLFLVLTHAPNTHAHSHTPQTCKHPSPFLITYLIFFYIRLSRALPIAGPAESNHTREEGLLARIENTSANVQESIAHTRTRELRKDTRGIINMFI